jgi:hypothetical protein
LGESLSELLSSDDDFDEVEDEDEDEVDSESDRIACLLCCFVAEMRDGDY